jgi:hypothetical protein
MVNRARIFDLSSRNMTRIYHQPVYKFSLL